MNKLFLSIIIIIIISPLNIWAYGNNVSEELQETVVSAKILEVNKSKIDSIEILKIEIKSGKYKGEVVEINYSSSDLENNLNLKKGNIINVVVSEVEDEVSYYFYSYNKNSALTLLLIIFIVLIIILGGMKGIKALISLIISICLFIFILIPLLLKGYDPVILSILMCIISTILTFIITNGFTKKTLIAIIGVVGGLIAAGIVVQIFTGLSNINGVISESEQMLAYIPNAPEFNYKGLLFAGIIIGALGACMDVAMELTSSLIEIKIHNEKVSAKDLAKSGFNIGKDIMGTMVNTLILAYTGGSLSLILLFIGFEKNFGQIINLDSIAAEIIRSLSGSIGLLCTIPITIGAFTLINKEKKEKKEKK